MKVVRYIGNQYFIFILILSISLGHVDIYNDGSTNSHVPSLEVISGYDDKVIEYSKINKIIAGGHQFTEVTYEQVLDQTIYFQFRYGGINVLFGESQCLWIDISGNKYQLIFQFIQIDSNRVVPIGRSEVPSKSNYFIGDSPNEWITDSANYEELHYPNIYDGIDLMFYVSDGRLKYEYNVHSGADPGEIKTEYRGSSRCVIDESIGDIIIETKSGELIDKAPITYQLVKDERMDIESRFLEIEDNKFSYEIGIYDTSRPLVIDPGISLGTYLGGSDNEVLASHCIDENGDIYVAGVTRSIDFPVTNGSLNTTAPGGLDMVIMKLKDDLSTLVYCTYIGGTGSDYGYSIQADKYGNVYLTGYTRSTDFPTTSSVIQRNLMGNDDIFLLKLNPKGNGLEYSTLIGGTDRDRGLALAIDEDSNAFITGYTRSTNFPTTSGCYDEELGGDRDVVLVKISPNATNLMYSTYFGGQSTDWGESIVVDEEGTAYVAGTAVSHDFPTTPGAYSTSFQGGDDDYFLLGFNISKNAFKFSTYVGGSGTEGGGPRIYIDSQGSILFGGTTHSTDFPMINETYQKKYSGGSDCIIAEFNESGDTIIASTYFGGSGDEVLSGINRELDGTIRFSGNTDSIDLNCTPNAVEENNSGKMDIFLVQLSQSMEFLDYCTYLGGANDERSFMMVATESMITISGSTDSIDLFDDGNVYCSTNSGGYDLFIAKIIIDLYTNATTPDKPLLFTVVPGDRQVILSWTPPENDEAYGVRGYYISRGLNELVLDVMERTNGTTRSFIDRPLVNGKKYYYSISAFNLIGEGNQTDILNATPLTIPSEPVNFNVTPGWKIVNLTWYGPADVGGELIGYILSRGRSPDVFVIHNNLGNVTGFTDTNVTSGDRYFYRLIAYNTMGNGTSTTILSAIPFGFPHAPVNTSVKDHDDYLSLEWDPPENVGGTPILGYNVYRRQTNGSKGLIGATYTTFFDDVNAIKGFHYFYSVSTINKYGEGPQSEEVGIIQYSVPHVPTNVRAIVNGSTVEIVWDPPLNNGGVVIDAYLIFRGISGSPSELIATVSDILSYFDLNLTFGVTVRYSVHARNRIGLSDPSSDTTVTPVGPPSVSEKIWLIEGVGHLEVQWSIPDNDGGSPIIQYWIYKGTSPFVLEKITEVDYTDQSYIDTNLEIGTRYYFRVSAVNSIGEGPFGEIIEGIPYGLPYAPINIQYQINAATLIITWDPPISDGGRPIKGYFLYRSDSRSPNEILVFNSNSTTFLDSELEYEITYYYTVSASNIAGEGQRSNSISVRLTQDNVPPYPPIDFKVQQQDGKVILTWLASQSDGGLSIIRYDIYRGRSQISMVKIQEVRDDLSFTDNKLTLGIEYYYHVRAINEIGESDPSKTISVVIESDEPIFDKTQFIVIIGIIISLGLLAIGYYRRRRNRL